MLTLSWHPPRFPNGQITGKCHTLTLFSLLMTVCCLCKLQVFISSMANLLAVSVCVCVGVYVCMCVMQVTSSTIRLTTARMTRVGRGRRWMRTDLQCSSATSHLTPPITSRHRHVTARATRPCLVLCLTELLHEVITLDLSIIFYRYNVVAL